MIPSIFIAAAPAAAINNTFGLSTDTYPYNKRFVNAWYITFIKNDFWNPTLPLKNTWSGSIVDACGTELFFAERFAQLKKVLKTSYCFLQCDHCLAS